MKRDALYRMVAMLSLAAGLVLCSCQSVPATPYPTATRQVTPTPSMNCFAVGEYLRAINTAMGRHLAAMRRWSPESGPNGALLRRRDLNEHYNQVAHIRPPREARTLHELLLQSIAEEKHAEDLLLTYYRTGSDEYKVDWLAAIDHCRALNRKCQYEQDDLTNLFKRYCLQE